MMISLALIAEELEALYADQADNSGRLAGNTACCQLKCSHYGSISERFDIRGFRLLAQPPCNRTYEDGRAYVVEAQDCLSLIGQQCPSYLIIVGPDAEGTARTLGEDACELLTISTDAPVAYVLAAIAGVFEAYAQWDERLLQSIAGNKGVAELLEIASEKLANPIVFVDSSLQVVSYAGDLEGRYAGTIWEDVISNGFSPVEFYTREEQVAVGEGLKPDALPAIIRPRRTPGYSNLFASVTLGDVMYGSIGQVDIAAPFTDGQVALADHVRNRLQQSLSASMDELAGGNELLFHISRILDGEPVDQSLLRHHLMKRGWDGSDPFRLLLCPCSHNANWALGQASRRERIGGAIPKAIVFLHDNDVVCLVRTADYDLSSGKLPKTLVRILKTMEMGCVVSDEYSSISDAVFALRQCRACTMGRDESNLRDVLFFHSEFENVATRLICAGLPSGAACNPKVMSLSREGYCGDVERGIELVRLLYSYLVSGRNVCECSRQLFMHRNTLAYRIGLLEKHLGVALGDLPAPDVLYLELSCLIALREQLIIPA